MFEIEDGRLPCIYIYIYTLLVCLSVLVSVRLYPINVKTAEPIGPKFCVGPYMTQDMLIAYE